MPRSRPTRSHTAMPRLWTRWRSIETHADHSGSGVYLVRICIDGVTQPLQRFLGEDRLGLLTIGMTGNMEKRRRQFVLGLKTGRGHSEANLLHQLLDLRRFRSRLPSCVYQYRFIRTRTREGAGDLEEALLKRYLRRFGEVPPLNSVIPNRYRDRAGRDASRGRI